jgi:hypothetical protein
MAVVFTVVSGPPQRPFLQRQASQQSTYELKPAGCLKRSMRKIAVIEAGDRKHPREVHRDRDRHSDWTPSHPDDAEAHQMH